MLDNILSGGLNELNKLKELLNNLYESNNKYENLVTEEERLEKNIKSMEKAINGEINNTTKKRKNEIEGSYYNQIDKIRTRIKKVRKKKNQIKNKKVTERINSETAELWEKRKQLILEGKRIFKQENIPSFCNTRLFYALFLPKSIGDIGIIIATLFVILLIIPITVYSLLQPNEKMIFVIYFVTVIIFGIMYMLIENNTKDKHIEKIREVGIIRNKIRDIKIQTRNIKINILKDKDESKYGLETYNQEILDLDNELNNVTDEKNKAIATFDNTTRFIIGQEIKGRSKEELGNLKLRYNQVYTEIKKTEEQIKNLSMDISNNYEVYLGKEYMSVDKIDQLLGIMKENNISKISEAIQYSKEIAQS